MALPHPVLYELSDAQENFDALARQLPTGSPLTQSDWAADGTRAWQEEWANFAAATNQRFTRATFSPRGSGCYSLRTDLPGVDLDGLKIGANTFDDIDTNGPLRGRRAEVAMANPWHPGRSHLHLEGDDVWFAFSQYLPNQRMIGDPFFFTLQLKAIGGGGGNPSISIDYRQSGGDLSRATRMRLNLVRSTDPTALDLYEAAFVNVPRALWFKALLHVVFHRNPAIGGAQLYVDLDGGGLVDISGWLPAPTMRDADPVSGGNLTLPGWDTIPMSHARLGIYRDPSLTDDATVFHDGFTCARTRAVAEANAFRP